MSVEVRPVFLTDYALARRIMRLDQIAQARAVSNALSGNPTKEGEHNIMQVIIRKYSGNGAKELFDVLEQNAADVQMLMGSVKGLASYTLARSGDGGFSVTVCQDQAGLDESAQKAKEWIAKNAANTGVGAPEISVGSVIAEVK